MRDGWPRVVLGLVGDWVQGARFAESCSRRDDDRRVVFGVGSRVAFLSWWDRIDGVIESTGSPEHLEPHVLSLVFAAREGPGILFFWWTACRRVLPFSGEPAPPGILLRGQGGRVSGRGHKPSRATRRSLAVVASLFLAGILLSWVLLLIDDRVQQRGWQVQGSRPETRAETFRRIVPGSPALTELVFALGQGHRVAAVGDDCAFPPEALALPRIGSLYNPNLERLAMLAPDLVIVQGRHERLEAWAAREGVRFHSVGRLDSLPDLRRVIFDLGGVLGVAGEARRLRRQVDRRLTAVAETVQGARRVPVFLTFGRTPGNLGTLYTCGPGSFLNDLLQIAGGRNVFAGATGSWPVVSKEALVSSAPEVILEVYARPVGVEAERRLEQDWAALAGLPAVASGRIRYLYGDEFQIPGPRVPETALAFARALHPELFADE